jgi:hypothetical protein
LDNRLPFCLQFSFTHGVLTGPRVLRAEWKDNAIQGFVHHRFTRPLDRRSTNFIALDAAGNPLVQSLIRVVGGRNALLVQRGLGRQSYACAPQCLPTVKLGDDAKYFVEVAGQVKDHNAQATGLQ